MSGHLDPDRLLEGWFAEGPTELPDRVVDSILNQLDENEQRRPFWLLRRNRMSRMILAVGGIAAVVIAVVAGGWYIGRNTTGPGTVATPTPVLALPRTGVVAPGRYYLDIQGYRHTFNVVGQGWEAAVNYPDAILTKGDIATSDFALLHFWGQLGTYQSVWTQPCQWTRTDITPGPAVADLATALSGLTGFTTTSPTDVMVGGHPGKELKLTIPQEIDFTSCDQGEYRSWDGRFYQEPGQTDDVRIFDVDGVRELLFTSYVAGTPSQSVDEMNQMVDSLEIAPWRAVPTTTP
jgi:hypothetical protein